MYASILAAIAALAIGSASAEPSATELRYFEMFDTVCLSTLGAPEAAVAAADAAGWQAMPESIISQVTSEYTPVVRGRMGPSLVDSGAAALLFAASSPPTDGVVATTCVIDAGNLPQMDAAALEGLVSRRLGIEATQSGLGPIWAYSGQAPFSSEIEAVSGGQAAMTARSRTEPFAMVQIKTVEGRPFLNLTRMGL